MIQLNEYLINKHTKSAKKLSGIREGIPAIVIMQYLGIDIVVRFISDVTKDTFKVRSSQLDVECEISYENDILDSEFDIHVLGRDKKEPDKFIVLDYENGKKLIQYLRKYHGFFNRKQTNISKNPNKDYKQKLDELEKELDHFDSIYQLPF